jgi:Xaa-Pro aminopeptidase
MTAEVFGPPYWAPDEIPEQNGFPRYPATEMSRRRAWLDGLLAAEELDAIVVGGATGPLETSIQYFTNWPPQVPSYLIVFPGSAAILFVRLWNHLPDAQRISTIEDIRYGGDTPAAQAEEVARLLTRREASRIGVIGSIPHGDLETMRKGLGDVSLIDLVDPYQRFRLVKSEAEMVFTRVASRMNDATIAALAAQLRPGLVEYEVAGLIEEVYLNYRGVNLIHFSLSTPMDDPQVWVPHQLHPNRRLEAGDVFVTEISTTFWGYAGQILRSFTIAEEPTPRFERLHQVALETYEAIVAVLTPGVAIGSVLDAAEGITAAGFDIWDDLVHGFGGAYLPPIVRTRASRGATHPDEWTYPEGTLLVVQPNVIDGKAGVQIGNSMQITPEGAVSTQRYPLELIRCA